MLCSQILQILETESINSFLDEVSGALDFEAEQVV
jgi:hypothetical protein